MGCNDTSRTRRCFLCRVSDALGCCKEKRAWDPHDSIGDMEKPGWAAICAAVVLWFAMLPAAAEPFDLQAFRLLAASDRAAGIAQGRAALDAGIFADDPVGERQMLWYMGGAAIGMPDDVALGEVVLRLHSLGTAHADEAALAYADFLRGARNMDLGETGDGLATVLRGANRIGDSDDPQLRATAASELCKAFGGTDKLSQGLEHCRRYTAAVRALGDEAVLGRAEYLEASALSRLDRPDEAIPLWRSARDRFVARGLDALAGRATGALASDLIVVGRADEALELARAAAQAGRESANPISEYMAQGIAARALLKLDRVDEGSEVIDAAIAGMRTLHQPTALAELLEIRILLADAAGDAALAQEARDELAASSAEPISELQGVTIEAMEQRYLAREQTLRIRELEQQNEHKATALEQSRAEAVRRADALRDQRLILWLVVFGCIALAVALVAIGLLLRAQRRVAAGLRLHAYHDALTGLENRRALFEGIERLLLDPNAGKAGHALILADVDHFKRINDRGGHPFGDRVLIGIAAALRETAGARAQVCRLGGEEFALLCPGIGREAAQELAHALRDAVRQLRFEGHEASGTTSISLGIAMLDTGMRGDVAAWMQAADGALYRAKAEGRDRSVVADGMAADRA